MDDKTCSHLEMDMGMTCASCSTRVERALGKLPGVTEVLSHVDCRQCFE